MVIIPLSKDNVIIAHLAVKILSLLCVAFAETARQLVSLPSEFHMPIWLTCMLMVKKQAGRPECDFLIGKADCLQKVQRAR
jgi:hypothetical protein